MSTNQRALTVLKKLVNITIYGLILFSFFISTMGLIDGMSPVTWLANGMFLIVAIIFQKKSV